MKKMIAILVLAACGSSSHPMNADAPAQMPDAPPAPPTAVVVAGDYMMGHPGILSTVNVEAKTVMQNVAPQGSVGDDPMLRHFGNELFVVNRSDGNNVTILNAQTFALVAQLATGTGSNPQDVAVSGNKLYVPVFGGKGVAVLTRGSNTIDTIDLSADDPDGKPNCNSDFIVGTNLYVSCELLDDTMQFLPPRGPGKVYVVDLGTNQITHTVTMMSTNPFGIFEQLPSGDLAIPAINFADNSGCVEKITTGATPASGGCVVTNAQLNIYAIGMAVQPAGSDNLLWMAVSAAFPMSNLQGFDLGTSMLWPAPISPTSEQIESVAVCPDGRLIVTDGTMGAAGARIYQTATEQTTAPLAIGLATINANALACY
jgi:hypothetical protein